MSTSVITPINLLDVEGLAEAFNSGKLPAYLRHLFAIKLGYDPIARHQFRFFFRTLTIWGLAVMELVIGILVAFRLIWNSQIVQHSFWGGTILAVALLAMALAIYVGIFLATDNWFHQPASDGRKMGRSLNFLFQQDEGLLEEGKFPGNPFALGLYLDGKIRASAKTAGKPNLGDYLDVAKDFFLVDQGQGFEAYFQEVTKPSSATA